MKILQPDSEITLWEKLTSLSRITAEMVFKLDGRRLVTRRDLRRIWQCEDASIKDYAKKGLPQVDLIALTAEGVERAKKLDPKFTLTLPNFAVYDLAEVNEWRDNNVDVKKSSNRLQKIMSKPHSQREENIDEPKTEPDSSAGYAVREMIAKTVQAEQQAAILTLKHEALKGSLVDAEDLDRAMAEQAIMHKTDKINDEKVLPTLLENKTASEIAEILHEHNQERLSHYDRLINKEFKQKETLYDVLEAVLLHLSKGANPSEIILVLDVSL